MITGSNIFLPGFSGAAGIPQDSFIGNASDDTNGTSWTFSSQAIGTPHSSRVVVIGCGSPSPLSNPTLTATLGGVSMTEVVQSGGFFSCYLFALAVASGSSEDIVISSSSSSSNMQLGVWALYDLTSATATDTANARNSTTLNLDCDTVSPAVAVAFSYNVLGTFTSFTGVTKDFEATTSESVIYTGGMSTGLSTETPRTITATWSNNNNATRSVAATWEKN